ncbi:hypothetical protein [Methanosarcina barkeri]|uniref:Uncharacterized protein n=1 Tax=Methanosarcina barkeri 227 TaxID=1434106 RepID=A0A0E3R7L8_METBA|nr:hypothetical protein [Methanosarcina barkeri]AKB59693.1 hypothetical protein MSBR2_3177 [Methanosarcina barkeri 227]
MSRKILFIILITLLFLSATTATAAENVKKAETPSDYTVVSSPGTEIGIVDKDIGILTVYDTIIQGEINLHEKKVSSGLNLLVVDLNWGDSTDSLRLRIYTPSGSLLGSYYDNADGAVNGRIRLYIKNANGIEAGTWKYQVYGYRVAGKEGYTI